MAEHVARGQNIGSNLFSVSETGVLAYDKGSTSEERQYAWFDRSGKEVGRVGGIVRSFSTFSVSLDGKRLASLRWADSGSGTDLWLTDLEHGRDSRLTFDSGNSNPVWSPDGAKLAFESGRGDGTPRIYLRASNNTGSDELLFESKEGVEPLDWSRDGKYIIFVPHRGSIDLWALPMTGKSKPIRLVATPRGCGNRHHVRSTEAGDLLKARWGSIFWNAWSVASSQATGDGWLTRPMHPACSR